jgi:hypothetical protein
MSEFPDYVYPPVKPDADEKSCEIEWFDECGHLAGDSNPSIGRVRIKEHDHVGPNHTVHIRASRWLRIWEAHAKRLTTDLPKQAGLGMGALPIAAPLPVPATCPVTLEELLAEDAE